MLRSLISPLLAAVVLQGFIRLLFWCRKINYLGATFSIYCILAGREFGKKNAQEQKHFLNRAEDSTMSLQQAQQLSLAHLSGQGFPFSTAFPSLPVESSPPELASRRRKAPLALWFCISPALWSALLWSRASLLSRVQLLIYQTWTAMSISLNSPGQKSTSQTTAHTTLTV